MYFVHYTLYSVCNQNYFWFAPSCEVVYTALPVDQSPSYLYYNLIVQSYGAEIQNGIILKLLICMVFK